MVRTYTWTCTVADAVPPDIACDLKFGLCGEGANEKEMKE